MNKFTVYPKSYVSASTEGGYEYRGYKIVLDETVYVYAPDGSKMEFDTMEAADSYIDSLFETR